MLNEVGAYPCGRLAGYLKKAICYAREQTTKSVRSGENIENIEQIFMVRLLHKKDEDEAR